MRPLRPYQAVRGEDPSRNWLQLRTVWEEVQRHVSDEGTRRGSS